MTVLDSTPRDQYTATSGQTVFPYTFEIAAAGDIKVLQNGTLINQGAGAGEYAVSGVGVDTGGNVTLVTGATTGDVLTIYRDMAYERLTAYTNAGDFLAADVNNDFDRLWLALQQNGGDLDGRVLIAPNTDPTSIDMTIPDKATRLGKYLKFNDTTGNPEAGDAAGLYTSAGLNNYNFIGNGSTTAFTLGMEPGGENNTQVYIDGVYQQKDTYNVSGAVVQFSAAPPNLSTIEVMVVQVLPVGSTTASQVSFTQAGSTYGRNVQLKLQESVSVKDFGAVGDGVTDDTAAIQAALNYAATFTSAVVVFPSGGIFRNDSQITLTSASNITLEGSGSIIYDGGISDLDSNGTGPLRRFAGYLFTSCNNIIVQNFVFQSNTNFAGNGVIKSSVNYSNHFRFYQCETVYFLQNTLDYRNNKPDSGYRSEAGFVNDTLRSFCWYFDESDNVHMYNCGVAPTNDTGEIIGYRSCVGVTIVGFHSLKGVGAGTNHSALFKVIACQNVDISKLQVANDYNGTLMDVSGNHIRIHDFHVQCPSAGVVDITREFGPSGGPVSDVVITNVSTTGKNCISTAPATGVLSANTGNTYTSVDNPISKVRVINCSTIDNSHPFCDDESGVPHSINSSDIRDGMYLEGAGQRIKNPEALVYQCTSADTTKNYEFYVEGYEYYQDEIAQDWQAECTVGGLGVFVNCDFNFSSTIATTNKSLLDLNDLRLTNGDAGITPENTTAQLRFVNCNFKNVTLKIRCNSDFIGCTFDNCIIYDAGIANIVTFDKDCRATLTDASTSLVGSVANTTFIFFQTIKNISWSGLVSGQYVKPTGYGVITSITSSGVKQSFIGAEFSVEALASTGGSAVEDYCISHWDRNDNATFIQDTANKASTMVLVQAIAAAASTSARLDVIDCYTIGKLLKDSGTFTNSTLMVVGNRCNSIRSVVAGTFTTKLETDNTTGLS